MKMHWEVHLYLIMFVIIFSQVFTSNAIPCDSCGKECTSACGTKHFRTCCFNYLRKRFDPNAMKMTLNNRKQGLIDFMMMLQQQKQQQKPFPGRLFLEDLWRQNKFQFYPATASLPLKLR